MPSVIDYKLNGGQIGTRTLKITNKLTETKQFKLYLGDWERDTIGKHKYYAPGTKPFSCSEWIKLEKDFIEVKPGETVPVVVTIVVPNDPEALKQMKWSMLFVEMINEMQMPKVDTTQKSIINQLFRLGIHIYHTPLTGMKKEVKLESFEEVAVGKDSSVYKVVSSNDGDIQVRCKGTLELTNLSTGEKIKLAPQEFPIFPKQKRVSTFALPPGIPKGRYSFLVLVDAGEDLPLEAAQKEFEIK